MKKQTPELRERTRDGVDPRAAASTRVDLCAVIGILILLLTVVWPALAGTRAQTDRVKCLSNLGETGKAGSRIFSGDRNIRPTNAGSACSVFGDAVFLTIAGTRPQNSWADLEQGSDAYLRRIGDRDGHGS